MGVWGSVKMRVWIDRETGAVVGFHEAMFCCFA